MTPHDLWGLTHKFLKMKPYENLNNYVDMMPAKTINFVSIKPKNKI